MKMTLVEFHVERTVASSRPSVGVIPQTILTHNVAGLGAALVRDVGLLEATLPVINCIGYLSSVFCIAY